MFKGRHFDRSIMRQLMSIAKTTPSEKSVQSLAAPHMGDFVTIRC